MVGTAMAKRACERVGVMMLLIRTGRQVEDWISHGGSEAMRCFDGSCSYPSFMYRRKSSAVDVASPHLASSHLWQSL